MYEQFKQLCIDGDTNNLELLFNSHINDLCYMIFEHKHYAFADKIVEKCNIDIDSILTIASNKNNKEVGKMLFDKYNIDLQSKFITACKNGDLNMVKYLLENNFNIDVHAKDESGFRAACENGDLNMVKYLLENNFNIDVHAEYEEGFKSACSSGHLNVVQYLLENNFNIDVNAVNNFVFKSKIRFRFTTNTCGFTRACANGHLNIVQYLLKNNFNIDVHAENEYGFRLACEKGHLNVVLRK